MSKKILYIGNKLANHGNSLSGIDTLGVFFQEFFTMFYASDKLNKISRLFDMLNSTIKYRKDIDYVLIDTYSTNNFYYAYLVAKLCQFFHIKYVPILHGGNLSTRLNSSPKLCKTLFGNSFANVAPSGFLQKEFQERGFSTIYIPNNIEIDKYLLKIREQISPKILFVRSFHKIYNTPMAIHTLNELLKEYPKAELCMVGPDKDGSMEECKVLAKELGVISQVTFTGKITKKEWHELSRKYDVFINTTNVDNTPISVMEAMALGLPVVSTNVGGVPFLVENEKEGLLVDKGNVQQMVEKIKFLIENPEKSLEFTTNARKKVEGFDWDVVKEYWIKLLK